MITNEKIEILIKDTGKYGAGVFANQDIHKGQKIHTMSGEVISFDECIERIKSGKEAQTDSLQVGLEMDMDLDEMSRSFNHSCDPNAGIKGFSDLVAIRDIKIGEEITYDYSATIGPNIKDSIWSMKCVCGSNNCRKILGNVLTIPVDVLDKYISTEVIQDYIMKELDIIRENNGVLPEYKTINL